MAQRTGGRPSANPTVAVTGAAAGLGAMLAERLVRDGVPVRGLDLAPGTALGVHWHAADVRDP